MTLPGSPRYTTAMVVAVEVVESLRRQVGRHVPDLAAMFGMALGVRLALMDPAAARDLLAEIERQAPQTGGAETMEVLFRRLAALIIEAPPEGGAP